MENYIKVIHRKFEEIFELFPASRFPLEPYQLIENNQSKYLPNEKPTDIEKSIDANKCEIEGNILNFLCPHCKYYTEVAINELNCRIFRHGFVVQKNEKGEIIALLSQIGPHESEEKCNELRNQPNITGCCKPFQIIGDNTNGFYVQICGYI